MDDPGWSWPAWKFGMKRDDLFSKLHDQYNTIPSAIQDPEAFHHDVFEISNEASSSDEFHRLMAVRKDQRIRELNESLESAAIEIIANPSLIGTAQWQHAVQLFRTKSLDSLVRYFASYLPDDHPWHRSDQSSSDSDNYDSMANSLESSFFEDKRGLTDEPFSIITSAPAQLPPSPRSMTMCSDSSADGIHHDYILNTLTPARTLSFSESESEHLGLKDSCPHLHNDDTSSEVESPISSVSDLSETHREEFIAITKVLEKHVAADDEFPATQLPVDSLESETPTPKLSTAASGFFEAKPSPLMSSLRHRSLSPSRLYPLVHVPQKDCRRSPRIRHRDCSPAGKGRRRVTGGPATRIQKPLPDPIRSRPRGRRRGDC